MMKWIKRTALGIAAVILALAILVWLLWIPSNKEPPYTFMYDWGETGTEPGQFRDPTGIAVTGGEVFVSDARNGRIQVFTPEGGLLRVIGESGEGPGQLGRPMNLAIHGERLFVADYWHDRISIFTLQGEFIRHLGASGEDQGQFNAPGGVAVGRDGSIYVADFYNQRVQHLDSNGGFVRQWGTTGETGVESGHFNYPTDVALAGGWLAVADGYNDRVQLFDTGSGDYLSRWGGPMGMNIYGPFNGWFATVTSIATDGAAWYVADFYNHRVQKFSLSGKFLTAFGEQGDGDGQFDYVSAVAVAPDGTVFATDLANNRVLAWAPESPPVDAARR